MTGDYHLCFKLTPISSNSWLASLRSEIKWRGQAASHQILGWIVLVVTIPALRCKVSKVPPIRADYLEDLDQWEWTTLVVRVQLVDKVATESPSNSTVREPETPDCVGMSGAARGWSALCESLCNQLAGEERKRWAVRDGRDHRGKLHNCSNFQPNHKVIPVSIIARLL